MDDQRSVNGVTPQRITSYDKYLSRTAMRRKPSALRELQKYVGSDLVLMAGGMPNGELFPIVEADLVLRDGRRLTINPDEMKKALQYGVTKGMADIIDWSRVLQRRVHQPPTLLRDRTPPSAPSDMDIIMCNGCQEAISKTLEAVLNEGDAILLEEATYPNVMSVGYPLGAKAVSVPSDSSGMIPSELRNILATWDTDKRGPRPKIMYCVPTGGNPTGANWSLDRKKAVYSIARKYDFLILEDDPYYYIQYNRPLTPSFLSLDEDGRVIRCDSFSKLIAAGARLGFISGPQHFLQKLVLHLDCSVACTNNLSQTVIRKILEDMGHDGFLRHGEKLAAFYKDRADKMVAIAEKRLEGLAEWSPPDGGMFMWIKLLGVKSSEPVVQRVIEKGAVLVNGFHFLAQPRETPYIRVSFSYASEKDMNKAFTWLAEALNEFHDDQRKK
ncbi:kynurenine/alpha-aminoadipate aminotransferase, mitochondrial-like isoform X1 [Haliotis rubra]|uniref:kynurenine/alpha-aminoadipate aminotransferase, mitochondrial-like isoform X1 n=2 Tax=Haliotis rubra TaxID=36100 RepID=UPI001EE55B7E|nr:kynurenine/alpha-aminoadipate aminotransferase, mitochondrial-like isoform X1 [Haliotis rubra]